MKDTFALFLFLLFTTFFSCKKDDPVSKLQFADIEFTMVDLRASGDTVVFVVNYPSTLVLKSDNTFTIDLGGAVSHGTYIWTIISDLNAEIKLTITQWTDFPTNQILSDKLKSVLQTVNFCFFSLANPSFLNLSDKNFDYSFLRTARK